jgi:ribonuclease E
LSEVTGLPIQAPVDTFAAADAGLNQPAFEDSRSEGADGAAAAGEGSNEERQGRRRRRRGGRDRDDNRNGADAGTDSNAGVEDQAGAALGATHGAAPEGELNTAADSVQDADQAPRTEGEDGGEGQARDGRRRRSRDRFRRERRDDAAPADENSALGDEASAPAAAPFVASAETTLPVQAEVEAAPAPVAEVAAAVVVASTPVETAVAPAPATAPAAVVAPAAPVVETFALPIEALQGVATSAGLQWVNSDAEKIRAAQEAIAAAPKPVHVPRERPPVVSIEEGPLVLVETRKDLGQVKLPFEQQ